jgi:hypothetical protein
MPLPTRHGLGLELRLQTVELEKSLRPPPPFQTWAGAYGVAVGSQKCSAPVFHCSVGWADRGFAGRTGPRHGRQPVGGQLGSTVGTAGGTPIGPINVQGESRSQIRLGLHRQ